MTIDEFLERLAALGLKWEVRFGGIRAGPPNCEHCPISAVTGDPNDFLMPASAAEKKLHMHIGDALDTVYAADTDYQRTAPLRSRLLKACGLEAE